jgi:hypothetical protein
VKSSDGPNVGTEKSVLDWLKSPFSVSTGSPAEACDSPGAAGFAPPTAAPFGTCPPVDGDNANVAGVTVPVRM